MQMRSCTNLAIADRPSFYTDRILLDVCKAVHSCVLSRMLYTFHCLLVLKEAVLYVGVFMIYSRCFALSKLSNNIH